MEELKAAALAVAKELRDHDDAAPPQAGGGSRQRRLPEELRLRFIEIRSQLYTRGIFDPVLIRFDTASAPQASNAEIAEEIEKLFA